MISVILLMAGSGTRMKEKVNKMLLPLGNKMVFQHSLDLFLNYNFEIICVINENEVTTIAPLLPQGVKYVIGGKTRQESVLNGLTKVTGDYVIIHDGARALLAKSVIDEIIKMHKNNEAILVCKPVKDTIKKCNGDKLITLDRSELIAAETPQCAPKDILLDAYLQAKKESYSATDDVSLLEKYYPDVKVNLIEGNEYNFKLTTPIDYKLANIIVGGIEND